MTDQNIRIKNLDAGSPARVAFDLMNRIAPGVILGNTNKDRADRVLALYAACYDAARGVAFDTSKIS